ncbi:MAG: UDP-N-acetylmuramate dehydrogenase [Clostridia bacterium]|nr:UDP-N-acetylmuramate dehydrogenase [Clostridia bacterium]
MENKYVGLEDILKKENIKYNEPMKNHTTMKVGGKCDCLVLPETEEEITKVVSYAREHNIKYYIIGNGSNLLVLDEGIRGLVIKISSKYCNVEVNDEVIIADSGVGIPKLAQIAKKHVLSGLEFACGIPGTVGGCVRMNAGAYGGEMVNVVEEVKYLDEYGDIKTILGKDMEFSYRHSIFSNHPKWIILSVKFKLKHGDIEEITRVMNENTVARRTKQPLEYPNFGSVFKRPEGYFVGKLVQDSGLRGKQIGGAQVSEKHTGFIVNKENATCKDVLDLIKFVQDTVYEKFGVHLNTEVEIIGGEN